MKEKIKVLIVGLGKIGMLYDLDKNSDDFFLSHTKSFLNHKDFELIGAVEPDNQKRIIFDTTYKKKSFKNLSEGLKVTFPELVVISSPTEFHYSNLLEIVEFNSVKVILCEKPLSYDEEEAKNMINLCKIKGIKLFVNYVRRADPGVLEIKNMIDKRIIDAPIKGFCWYTKGMIHTASHFVDLCYFWLGDVQNYEIIYKGDTWFGEDPEPSFFIEFEKGKVIFQSGWEKSFSHYTVELISKQGRLRYDNSGLKIRWQGVINDPDFKGYKILDIKENKINNDMNKYQFNVTNLISKYFKKEKVELTDGDEAYTILEMLNNLKNRIRK